MTCRVTEIAFAPVKYRNLVARAFGGPGARVRRSRRGATSARATHPAGRGNRQDGQTHDAVRGAGAQSRALLYQEAHEQDRKATAPRYGQPAERTTVVVSGPS